MGGVIDDNNTQLDNDNNTIGNLMSRWMDGVIDWTVDKIIIPMITIIVTILVLGYLIDLLGAGNIVGKAFDRWDTWFNGIQH